jgi:hypothetical protein
MMQLGLSQKAGGDLQGISVMPAEGNSVPEACFCKSTLSGERDDNLATCPHLLSHFKNFQ